MEIILLVTFALSLGRVLAFFHSDPEGEGLERYRMTVNEYRWQNRRIYR